MSKYYWIKLKTNFYQKPEILWLLEQPGGSDYVILYHMLCLKAAEEGTDALLKYIADFTEPYSFQDLAKITGFSAPVIKAGLEYLIKVGLIVMQEDNSIFIPDIKHMVGSDSQRMKEQRELADKKIRQRLLGRERVRRHRAKQKALKAQKKLLLGEGGKS